MQTVQNEEPAQGVLDRSDFPQAGPRMSLVSAKSGPYRIP
jgi:hypothetical protein